MNIQNIDLFEMHEPLTGSFPFVAQTASLPEDISSISIHWQDTMELLLIREGKGLVSIDLENVHVKKGDICLILPGQLHSINADAHSNLKISMIQFPLSLLSGTTPDDDAFLFLKPLSEGIQTIPWLITPEYAGYDDIYQCFEEMFQLQTFYSAAYPLGIKSCLFRLFYLLFYNEPVIKQKSRPQKSVQKTKQIICYLTEHYSEPLSTEQLAKVCGFSESHFTKFFKSTIGITFTECVTSYRLSKASKFLISNSDEPIMDVAKKCGFHSISYFNRVFKKKYGITPTALRESNRPIRKEAIAPETDTTTDVIDTKSAPTTLDPSLS